MQCQPWLRWPGSRLSWNAAVTVGDPAAVLTGAATATPSSDLDVILRQAHRLEPHEADALRAVLVQATAPARIDVLLETPHGDVSLADLAAKPTHVLVRTPHGARLMGDPWIANTSSVLIRAVP